MNRILSRIAALLAFVIGVMAVFAGGQVLLGRDPGYYVIDWLPVYNFVLGVLTVIIVAPLIWRGSRYALPAAVATLVAHTLVLIILLTVFRDVVATDSIRAMLVRIVAWLVILTLLFIQARRNRPVLA